MIGLDEFSTPVSSSNDYLVFRLGENYYAIEIQNIQEIKKVSQITTVHRAKKFIRGVINIRGKIVTIIDAAKRFNFSERTNNSIVSIILPIKNELIGVVVDEIDDIIQVKKDNLSLPPGNLENSLQDAITYMINYQDKLIGILDTTKLVGVKI